MKKITKQKAFSLIELSIVIIVIGILIAGVTSATSLIYKAKLSSARSFTQSSPVTSIKDLALWVDATRDGNLTNVNGLTNVEEGDEIKSWRDQNSHITDPVAFTTSTSGTYPLYRAKSPLNGLPALEFDGVDDYLSTPDSPSNASPNDHTIFAVFSVLTGHSTNGAVGILTKQEGAFTSSPYSVGFNGATLTFRYRARDSADTGYTIVNASGLLAEKPFIYSVTFDHVNNTDGAKLYINGDNVVTDDTISDIADSGEDLTIGAGELDQSTRFCKCLISEIIMYNRELKNEERRTIEEYLSTKWDVDITI